MKLSQKIADDIGIDANYIEIIATRNNRYARYLINKKNGGKREILQPSKELKVIQRWLVKNIFNHFPVSEYSVAYSKGDSVKRNALMHKDANFLLHTDITNFFPSITRSMFVEFFNKNSAIIQELELSEADINLILDICLYSGQYLVVGSVASPRIANIIMYDFDIEVYKLLKQTGNYYTRYADDLIISSQHFIDEKIIESIAAVMNKYGFVMNRKKTFFMNKKHCRQITGVVIDNNNNSLSVGNKRYKEFERMLYKYLVKGEGNAEYLKGYLAYIKEINNTQYRQIRNIYVKYDTRGTIFTKESQQN